MKNRITGIILLLLAVGLPAPSWAKACRPSDPPDTECTLQVERLRPTQFAVGSVAVTCKAQKLADKSKRKLKKYLKDEDRQVPVVIGPDGDFYMTDHHHLATALYRTVSSEWGDKSKLLRVKISESYYDKDTSWGEFWEAMQKAHSSYNFDNKGTPDMNFALLPKDVSGLLNDPYRTLSRWVRESCGYVKKGKEQCDQIRTDHPHEAPYFMEFYWGEFFRQELPLPKADLTICKSIPYSKTCLNDEVTQLKAIYERAMQLAGSPAAEAYLKEQKLDAWDYGYNPSGEHVKLEWGGYKDACEKPVGE